MACRTVFRQFRRFNSLWLLFGALLTGCSNLQYNMNDDSIQVLPAITKQASDVRLPGKFVWHDLLTPDASAAQQFYGELLGWSFQPDGKNYWQIMHQGQLIGGIAEIPPPDDNQQAFAIWLPSLSVEDVDAAANRASQLGGKLLKGPLDMPGRGRGALISDPDGARLVLLHSSSGDPTDRPAKIGDWLWNEIWSRDLQRTGGFYRQLVGYDTIESHHYLILEKDGKWRAGVRLIAEQGKNPAWIPVVRVADPAAMLSKVENLGGVVWVRPGETAENPDTALISDNRGALLMLQHWEMKQ